MNLKPLPIDYEHFGADDPAPAFMPWCLTIADLQAWFAINHCGKSAAAAWANLCLWTIRHRPAKLEFN